MRQVKAAADDKATAAARAAGLTQREAALCNVATMMMVQALAAAVETVGFKGEKERDAARIIAESLHDAVKAMADLHAIVGEDGMGAACDECDRQAAARK